MYQSHRLALQKSRDSQGVNEIKLNKWCFGRYFLLWFYSYDWQNRFLWFLPVLRFRSLQTLKVNNIIIFEVLIYYYFYTLIFEVLLYFFAISISEFSEVPKKRCVWASDTISVWVRCVRAVAQYFCFNKQIVLFGV